MNLDQAVNCFQALGQNWRLETFRVLAQSGDLGMTAGTVADRVGLSPSQATFHLKELEHCGLCASTREGRFMRYRVVPDQVQALLGFLLNDCCRGHHSLCAPALDTLQALDGPALGADGRLSVLFVCPGNDARSVMAAALLNTLGGRRFVATSAGTQPEPQVANEVTALLGRFEHEMETDIPKPLSALDGQVFDFVFTLSSRVTESDLSDALPGGMTANWRIVDPLADAPSCEIRAAQVADAYRQIRRRIEALVALPMTELNQMTLRQRVDEIGQMTEGDGK